MADKTTLRFAPFQTVIRSADNTPIYKVSTAYSSEGFYQLGSPEWETIVFLYYSNGECSPETIEWFCCESRSEAIVFHMQCVGKYALRP